MNGISVCLGSFVSLGYILRVTHFFFHSLPLSKECLQFSKGVWICVGRTNVFRVTWLGGIHSLSWWLVVSLSFSEHMQALVALLGIGSHCVYISPRQTNIRPRGFAVHLQPLWWRPLNLHSGSQPPTLGGYRNFWFLSHYTDVKGCKGFNLWPFSA